MSGTISISTSNTVAGLGNILGIGYTTAILTNPSLTGVTVQPELGIASNYTIIGSSGSDVTVNPTLGLGIGINLLSTLHIETNGATVSLQEGALASAQLISGTTIDINGGSFQEAAGIITASLLSATDIGFSGATAGTYVIESATPGSFLSINLLNADAPITGFSNGDVIDDQNLNYTAATGYSISGTDGGTETITVLTSDHSNLTFALANSSLALGSFSTTTGPLHLSEDPSGGLSIAAICYLAGTRILTARGEMKIEDIRTGDLVATRLGGLQPVRWIGWQNFARRFVQNNRGKIPVRIRAGALGGGLPERDLFVSPGHSMLLDGVLVLARSLVNGVTITQDSVPETVTYFQLEFSTHDCVLAEGCWSESFIDGPGLRAQFHNAAEYLRERPDYVEPPETLLCAPRPESGPTLAQALAPVLARATAILAKAGGTPGPLEGWIDDIADGHITGWAIDTQQPEMPVWLDVWSGTTKLGTVLACEHRADLEAAGKGSGRCAFTFALPDEAGTSLSVRRAGDTTILPMASGCQERLRAA